MSQKLIVMSADGLVREDVEEMQKTAIWQKYFGHCCGVREVRSIYPTITYPCHTTMCTGVWPEKHQVWNNLVLIPGAGKEAPWKWFREENKWAEDLFYSAKRAGKTTAAVFWPVTGNHPAIDYLIAEYWPQSEEDTNLAAFERSGSSPEVLKIIERRIGNVKVRTHPQTDDFLVECTCDIIREFQPDLVMIHPGQVDAYRHNNGIFNDRVTLGVVETLGYVEKICKVLEEENLTDVYNFVLTSDHGLIDVKRCVRVNTALREAGLIRVNEKGEWISWNSCCISGGTSALVYVQEDAKSEVYAKTKAILDELVAREDVGISEVLTQEEAKARYHLGGKFAFVLETDGCTNFDDKAEGALMEDYELEAHYCRGNHGHRPDKGPQPIFCAIGNAFRLDIWLENGRLVDEAPTWAKVLGVELKDADGVAMETLLK